MRQDGWKTGLQFAARVSVLLATTWTVCADLILARDNSLNLLGILPAH